MHHQYSSCMNYSKYAQNADKTLPAVLGRCNSVLLETFCRLCTQQTEQKGIVPPGIVCCWQCLSAQPLSELIQLDQGLCPPEL